MMSTAPPPPSFDLTQEQVQRLIAYIQVYRRFAWEWKAPTVQRNDLMRVLQGIQGTLMSGIAQPPAVVALPFTGEETTAIQQMAKELLAMYGLEPASEERNRTLADLATLRAYLARPLTFK